MDIIENIYEITYRCPVLHTKHTVEVRALNEEEAVSKVIKPFYTILKVAIKDVEQQQN